LRSNTAMTPGRAGSLSSDSKRFQGLTGPTLAASLAMLALLGLGTWQIQRLHWKLDLIAKISERVRAPTVAIESLLANDISDAEYTHVTATGRFHHDLERYLYAPGDGDWGWDVLTPLELADGRAVIVNRGYVPRQQQERRLRPGGLPDGVVTVSGLVRLPPGSKPWWTPAGDVSKFAWYWPEISAMAASMAVRRRQPLSGLYIDADVIAAAAPPTGGATNLDLPNRHLEYAVTWFALAATLALVYVLFVVYRLRGARG